MLKVFALVATLILLSSCGDPHKEVIPPVKKFTTFTQTIVVEEDPLLATLGKQQTVGGVCFIKLKKYPVCLQHEVRHCIEGNWRKGVSSDEDCFE